MLRQVRSRLTYANVVATLALFLAMGGSSYALTVGSGSIKNNSVRSVDVRNGSLRDRDVARAGLGGRAIKESRLDTVPAASTLKGVTTIRAIGDVVPNDTAGFATATCPGGSKAISGGGGWVVSGIGDGNQGSTQNAPITVSRPNPPVAGTDNHTGWQVLGRNLSALNRQLTAYAICVPK